MDDFSISPIIQGRPFLPAPAGIRLPCGSTYAATDREPRNVDLNELLIMHPNNTFTFRVKGNQAITQGILDGDIAVVDRSAMPQPNDLVLWHNGRRFGISRSNRLHASILKWGVITAVIHTYRPAST